VPYEYNWRNLAHITLGGLRSVWGRVFLHARPAAPTEAGERLVQTLAPMLHDLDQSIADLSEFRDKPAGTMRITTVEHAAKTILCPALAKPSRHHG